MKNLKPAVIKRFQGLLDETRIPGIIDLFIKRGKAKNREEAKTIVSGLIFETKAVLSLLEKSKTIVVSSELILAKAREKLPERSIGLLEQKYLPFSHVFFQIDPSFGFQDESGKTVRAVQAVLMAVSEPYEGEVKYDPRMDDKGEESVRLSTHHKGDWYMTMIVFEPGHFRSQMLMRKYDKDGKLVGIRAFPDSYDNMNSEETMLFLEDVDDLIAVTCDYIDAENTILEVQEGAPPKVNRKRERQGKRTLEPYYICKIVKAQPSETHATGEGSEHGHRYDVRGHYRHYKSGKVVRIRPHQRGLKHDTYIPKTYVVEKERENGPTREE